MSGEVVPFGKYKDKSVELMAADRQYVDWLVQQPWFKERYANIYNVVINYQAEPTETPEHNKIQMMFLDENFVRVFLTHIVGGEKADRSHTVEFEKRLIDWNGNRHSPRNVTPPVDVVVGHISWPMGFGEPTYKWTAAIEIKPTVGDDFPAVLRQMKESRAGDLLLRDYIGEGATEAQFRAFFKSAGIRVTFLSELEEGS